MARKIIGIKVCYFLIKNFYIIKEYNILYKGIHV